MTDQNINAIDFISKHIDVHADTIEDSGAEMFQAFVAEHRLSFYEWAALVMWAGDLISRRETPAVQDIQVHP